MRDTAGFSSTIRRNASSFRNPAPMRDLISPLGVGQSGHASWQIVAASRRMASVRILFHDDRRPARTRRRVDHST